MKNLVINRESERGSCQNAETTDRVFIALPQKTQTRFKSQRLFANFSSWTLLCVVWKAHFALAGRHTHTHTHHRSHLHSLDSSNLSLVLFTLAPWRRVFGAPGDLVCRGGRASDFKGQSRGVLHIHRRARQRVSAARGSRTVCLSPCIKCREESKRRCAGEHVLRPQRMHNQAAPPAPPSVSTPSILYRHCTHMHTSRPGSSIYLASCHPSCTHELFPHPPRVLGSLGVCRPCTSVSVRLERLDANCIMYANIAARSPHLARFLPLLRAESRPLCMHHFCWFGDFFWSEA